jgi:hypothetical protein
MTCYKATRPDGRDFHSGSIDYAAVCGTGAIIRHPGARIMTHISEAYGFATLRVRRGRRMVTVDPASLLTIEPQRLVRDEPATYISISVSETDCTGFAWPARLFRVEPVGRIMTRLTDFPSKRAVSALRVIEELPAWRLLGPQGQEVAALIERAGELTADEIERSAAAWGAVRDAARTAARTAAWGAARGAARGAALDATRAAAWAAARDAAGDAAGALVVRDLISAEHFEALYGPWREAL